jgi:hypothetical protein
MGHLRRLVLANLIETFERFIKELAAVCIDQLSAFVTDDRYNAFTAKGNEIIAHFEAGSIGKALCESDTWLSNDVINNRFRKLLAPSGKDIWEDFLLPAKNQGRGPSKDEQEKRAATLGILWQLRHNLTHNSGVLTGSDSMKLKVLTRRQVDKGRILAPTEEDLRYVKRFFPSPPTTSIAGSGRSSRSCSARSTPNRRRSSIPRPRRRNWRTSSPCRSRSRPPRPTPSRPHDRSPDDDGLVFLHQTHD